MPTTRSLSSGRLWGLSLPVPEALPRQKERTRGEKGEGGCLGTTRSTHSCSTGSWPGGSQRRERRPWQRLDGEFGFVREEPAGERMSYAGGNDGLCRGKGGAVPGERMRPARGAVPLPRPCGSLTCVSQRERPCRGRMVTPLRSEHSRGPAALYGTRQAAPPARGRWHRRDGREGTGREGALRPQPPSTGPGRSRTVRGDSRVPAPAPSVLAAAGHPKHISGVPQAGLGAAALVIPFPMGNGKSGVKQTFSYLGKDFY